MKEVGFFILSTTILTTVLYFIANLYLRLAKKIDEPLKISSHIKVGLLWILTASIICSIILISMKIVDYSGVNFSRAAGALPILGLILHFIKNKNAWREYHTKFSKKA